MSRIQLEMVYSRLYWQQAHFEVDWTPAGTVAWCCRNNAVQDQSEERQQQDLGVLLRDDQFPL